MFNKDIIQNTSIKSAEELIINYYNFSSSEGKPKLQITKKEIDKNFWNELNWYTWFSNHL